MDHAYETAAIKTKPDTSTLTSLGYPTDGTPSLGIPATRPGAAWFDSVTSELVNAITAGGLTPDKDNQEQLAKAMIAIVAKYGCPSGVIMPFSGPNIPDNFLLCNGTAVSRTDYSSLFSAIGTTFGAGDGSTTFNLPDLRDRFIEGVGTNALGTYLEAGLPNIQGVAGSVMVGLNSVSTGAFATSDLSAYSPTYGGTTSAAANFRLNANSYSAFYKEGNTVQPKSLCFNYVIKV